MSRIYIKRKHDAGLEQARAVANEVAKSIGEHYGIDYYWDAESLVFSRPGVDGRIDISAEHIEVAARLGLLVAIFKDSIEAEINRKLDGLF